MEERARLVVGLGNPGEKYALTRHNLGWQVVLEFARNQSVPLKRNRWVKGLFGKVVKGEQTLYLLLPMTYMNLSGNSVKSALKKYKIAYEDLLVIVDDVALPLGECRLRRAGSHGGHNGLRNIEERLGTREYARLKVGIDKPPGEQPLDAYVLSPFSKKEREMLPSALDRAERALDLWMREDIDQCMQEINQKVPRGEGDSPSSVKE